MLVRIPAVLTPELLKIAQTRLAHAGEAWVDGRATAGHQGAQIKRNLQLAEDSVVARDLGELVLGALERNPLFISAVLPDSVYPPMFNRYEGGMHFGEHVDGAIRLSPRTGSKMRTDLSATLFLSDPKQYDGGELTISDTYGDHAVKLAAGDLVVYPAGSRHRVAAVTRGVRTACVFWVQSLVRDDAQRVLLFELDQAVQRLNATGADDAARVALTGCYHNLLRMWGST